MKHTELQIDFENSLGPWIGKTTKIMDYHLHEAMNRQGLDLSKEQMIVLKKLHDNDGINQNELASLTYRDKSSLARLLSKMESKNYIIRKQSSEDKRANEIFLTPYGREIFQKTRPVIKGMMDIIENNITVEEKQRIIGILSKIQSNFADRTISIQSKL